MDVNLWHTYCVDPQFNRTVPEILACFDGLYQRVIDKDYGTPAYERLPDGIDNPSPEKLIYEV